MGHVAVRRARLVLLALCALADTSLAQSGRPDSTITRPDTARRVARDSVRARQDSVRAQAMEAIVVRPRAGRGDASIVSGRQLSVAELARIPQPLGDLFRAMARLPGVSSSDLSARLALRGASPEETLVLFDGMRLRDPFHLKDFDGSFSVLDESVIDGLTLITGHTPVEFGDQLGGVVSVTPRAPTAGIRSSVQAGLTGVRMVSSGGATRSGTDPNGPASVQRSWLASGRRSWLSVVLNAAGANDEAYTSVRPVFDDALLRVAETRVAHDGTVTRIAFNALRTRDGLHFRANGDPAVDSDYGAGYAWFTGTQHRARSTSAVTLGLTTVHIERSATGAGSQRTATLADEREIKGWSLRATQEYAMTERLQWRAGTDLLLERADAATWRRIGIGAAPTTRASGGRRAVWTGLRYTWNSHVSSDVGVRTEWWPHLLRASQRGRSVDPRASLAWNPHPTTALRLALGQSALGMGVGDRALADADSLWYGAVRARSWSVSADQRMPHGVTWSIAAYRRYEQGGRPRFVNVTGGLTPVGELEADRQRLEVSGGRAFGIEMALRGTWRAQWQWNASYTSARATDVRPNGAWAPRPWDVRHAATGDLSWTPRGGWVLAAGASWHTGWPYSRAVVQVLTPTRATAAWPTWMNGRSAHYWRVDARIARTWMVRHTEWRVYADAFNLLNRFNGRGEWTRLSRTGTTWSMARYPVQLAPRIPTAGVTVTF